MFLSKDSVKQAVCSNKMLYIGLLVVSLFGLFDKIKGLPFDMTGIISFLIEVIQVTVSLSCTCLVLVLITITFKRLFNLNPKGNQGA